MQLVIGTTHDTSASVTFPYLQLNYGRDYPSSFRPRWDRATEVFLTFYGFQSELKYGSTADPFAPCIEKVEHSVV
jgi:hypothetical protein